MPGSKQTTNKLLLLTIFNHASWSTMHVASRYLQVYAEPITFDGQGLLSSAKGFAAFFLFSTGIINLWIENGNTCEKYEADAENSTIESVHKNYGAAADSLLSSLPSVDTTLTAGTPCLRDSNHNISVETDEKKYTTSEIYDTVAPSKQQQSAVFSCSAQCTRPSKTLDEISFSKQKNGCQNNVQKVGIDASRLQRRKKVIYTLLFAFVSTTRASSNIASSKYTYPYNITLIASLTPVIIAILDTILLRSPFPPLIWPTIMLSSFGGSLIAISQSLGEGSTNEQGKISATDNIIGCSLQLLSAVFSALARILMKRTGHILTSTHIVQTNNVSNCLFPFIYTMVYNPASWGAFRYLLISPKSLLAWCTMSIGVYSFASTLQIRLVRNLGPGFYSSWVGVRVLGSMILSAYVLGEGIDSWLEWAGAGLMIVTISFYLAETRKWMDRGKEQQGDDEEEG